MSSYDVDSFSPSRSFFDSIHCIPMNRGFFITKKLFELKSETTLINIIEIISKIILCPLALLVDFFNLTIGNLFIGFLNFQSLYTELTGMPFFLPGSVPRLFST
jgi:hypothetical protein